MHKDATYNAEAVKKSEGIVNKMSEIVCVCVCVCVCVFLSFNIICILHISLCVPEKVGTSHRISEQTNK